jgi:hypothetical protein
MMAAYSLSELIGIYQNLEQSCHMHEEMYMEGKQQSYFSTINDGEKGGFA